MNVHVIGKIHPDMFHLVKAIYMRAPLCRHFGSRLGGADVPQIQRSIRAFVSQQASGSYPSIRHVGFDPDGCCRDCIEMKLGRTLQIFNTVEITSAILRMPPLADLLQMRGLATFNFGGRFSGSCGAYDLWVEAEKDLRDIIAAAVTQGH